MNSAKDTKKRLFCKDQYRFIGHQLLCQTNMYLPFWRKSGFSIEHLAKDSGVLFN